VLKGAQLFRIWSVTPHRPTRDADFLSFGAADTTALTSIFNTICLLTPTEPEGLSWRLVEVTNIRDQNAYGGIRIKIIALLGTIRIPLQIDVGFGDAVTPATETQVWTSLLDFSDIPLTAYPIETVIAEKLEAMISLSMANSRMKDFFNLHWISQHQQLSFKILSQAVTNTFNRRNTSIPTTAPIALTTEFSTDANKVTQWNAFIRKNKLPKKDLSEVINQLTPFIMPILSKKNHHPHNGHQ
jgi:hypothetical protein